MTSEDLDRSLYEFTRRVIAKILGEWLTDRQIHGRVENLEEDDTFPVRKQLIHNLKQQRDVELFDWKEDHDEEQDLAENTFEYESVLT